MREDKGRSGNSENPITQKLAIKRADEKKLNSTTRHMRSLAIRGSTRRSQKPERYNHRLTIMPAIGSTNNSTKATILYERGKAVAQLLVATTTTRNARMIVVKKTRPAVISFIVNPPIL